MSMLRFLFILLLLLLALSAVVVLVLFMRLVTFIRLVLFVTFIRFVLFVTFIRFVLFVTFVRLVLRVLKINDKRLLWKRHWRVLLSVAFESSNLSEVSISLAAVYCAWEGTIKQIGTENSSVWCPGSWLVGLAPQRHQEVSTSSTGKLKTHIFPTIHWIKTNYHVSATWMNRTYDFFFCLDFLKKYYFLDSCSRLCTHGWMHLL